MMFSTRHSCQFEAFSLKYITCFLWFDYNSCGFCQLVFKNSHSERHSLILDVEANEFYQNFNSSFTADNIGEMLQKLEACLFILEFKLQADLGFIRF